MSAATNIKKNGGEHSRSLTGALHGAVVDPGHRINVYNTLNEALRAARPTPVGFMNEGPAETTTTDYVVGGAPTHPLYYVVPMRRSAAADGATGATRYGPPGSRLWLRRR